MRADLGISGKDLLDAFSRRVRSPRHFPRGGNHFRRSGNGGVRSGNDFRRSPNHLSRSGNHFHHCGNDLSRSGNGFQSSGNDFQHSGNHFQSAPKRFADGLNRFIRALYEETGCNAAFLSKIALSGNTHSENHGIIVPRRGEGGEGQRKLFHPSPPSPLRGTIHLLLNGPARGWSFA